MAPRKSIFGLDGQVVLVTGAGGGIGREIAVVFAEQGADVVLADQNVEACEEVALECRRIGVRVKSVAADLAHPSEVDRLTVEAHRCFGRVDALICNAGFQPIGPSCDVTPAEWNSAMQVNLGSAHALCARLAPGMAERRNGCIILMSSITALRGNRSLGLYSITKAGLMQLARNLAVEWGPQGVRANAIAPGFIRTPLTQRFVDDDAFMSRRISQTPLRRAGEAREVAGVAAMLASSAGSFITGQTLVVDGGTLISESA